jgi:GWxTD domain-containing protein
MRSGEAGSGAFSEYRAGFKVPKKTRKDGLLLRLRLIPGGPVVFNENEPKAQPGDSCRVFQSFASHPDSLWLISGGISRSIPPSDEASLVVPASQDVRTRASFGRRYIDSWWQPLTSGLLCRRELTPIQQRFVLQYYLTETENKVLRKTSESDLQNAIDLIWQQRDPTPGTVQNEEMEAYYRRVRTADSLFGTPGFNHGWETDMGKVYLRYGPPDSTSSDPFPVGIAPYVIWNYTGSGRTFVFRDWKGYGVYELQTSYD